MRKHIDHGGLPMGEIPDLRSELRCILRQIPCGRVTTYGDLAGALGDRAASRWVGGEMLNHEHDDECRCHRVVLRTGEVGKYLSGNAAEKIERLRSDGVDVQDNRVNLSAARFTEFMSDRPLRRLSEWQQRIPAMVSLESSSRRFTEIAGVDVSYGDVDAVAAYAVVDSATGELLRSTTVRRQVTFPYIPGYLAYRELPLLLDLLREVTNSESPAEVILVDGNGILHPRRAGLAAHLGIVTGLRTVGVGKKLLCGRVERSTVCEHASGTVRLDDDIVGAEMVSKPGSRPVYVSPGHRIGVKDSAAIVRQCFRNHRLPEPLYWADRLSRERAKSGFVGIRNRRQLLRPREYPTLSKRTD